MFTGVLHTEIDSVWPEVEPWIKQACERMCGRYEPKHIKQRLIDRSMQLWTYRDAHGVAAVCVTHIEEYPTGKKYCRIFMGMGRNRREWQDSRHIIEQWARSQGCDGMESFARRGWTKIFNDYRHSHNILEKEF